MNYELAKKLKDAGFPQENGLWGYADIPEKRTHNPQGRTFIRKAEIRLFPWHRRGGFNKAAYPVVMCPTLSELIAACGEEFFALKVYFSPETEWVAMPRESGKTLQSQHYGKTPEEAVANLWLSLNPKS